MNYGYDKFEDWLGLVVSMIHDFDSASIQTKAVPSAIANFYTTISVRVPTISIKTIDFIEKYCPLGDLPYFLMVPHFPKDHFNRLLMNERYNVYDV